MEEFRKIRERRRESRDAGQPLKPSQNVDISEPTQPPNMLEFQLKALQLQRRNSRDARPSVDNDVSNVLEFQHLAVSVEDPKPSTNHRLVTPRSKR